MFNKNGLTTPGLNFRSSCLPRLFIEIRLYDAGTFLGQQEYMLAAHTGRAAI